MTHFQAALAHVLKHEGGYSNNPLDAGGETYCGISRKYWSQWPIWNLIDSRKPETPSQYDTQLAPLVTEFYRKNFWHQIKGDLIESKPIAVYTLDSAVLLGTTLASRYLQRAYNALNRSHLECDGVIGHKTLQAVNTCDAVSLLAEYRSLRRVHHEKVAFNKPSQAVFLQGWLNRANAELT